MQLPEIVLALRAVEEGELQREDLARLFTILESWDRADLKISCGELLVREFRISSAKVRRWEAEIGGQPNRRVGKYELHRRIGQGGMGIVFEASHPNLDRPVAVKILPPSHGKNPEAVQRFLTETKSAGRFNDPHIVHAYDAGIDGDIPFLVMEFIDGENLFQLLQRTGRFDVDIARDLLTQAARALLVLEEAGWVHGDGKPSNWIIDTGGTLKLADLGLCRPPGRPGGTVFGSPPYIAPELLRQGTSPDHRVDLYSLGATFYHLLSGRPPYDAVTVAELARCQKQQTIVPLLEVRPDVPDDLASVVMDLLRTEPQERLGSSREILSRLGAEAAVATAPGTAGGAGASSSSRWGVVALVAVLLVGAGYGLARFVFPSADPARSDEQAAAPAGSVDDDAATGAVPVPADLVAAQALLDEQARIEEQWQALSGFQAAAEQGARSPTDYVALAGWLAGEAKAHPKRSTWEQEMREALDAEAATQWANASAEVAELSRGQKHGAALEVLSLFPARLRAGRYQVAWEQTRVDVERKRERIVARALVEIRTALAAGDSARARRVFAKLAEHPVEERVWLRQRVVGELGGVPWLDAVADGAADVERQQAERRAFVIAELQRGVIPPSQAAAWIDWPMEMALDVLRRTPAIVSDKNGDPWERLHRYGCLAHDEEASRVDLVKAAVSLLDPAALDQRNARRECKAAWWQQQARRAAEEWDLVTAERAWEQLFKFPDSLAAIEEQPSWELQRVELRRGAFLRSGAFAAAVAVHWGEPPVFRYAAPDAHFFRDWRGRAAHWQATEVGLRSRAATGVEPMELFIPFEGALRIEVALDLPPEWLLVTTYGDNAIAIGRSSDGVVAAVTAPRGQIDRPASLKGAAPRRWAGAEQSLSAPQQTLVFVLDAATWRIEVGKKTLSLAPAAAAGKPRWLALGLSRDVLLRDVTVVGQPNDTWLDARARALAAAAEGVAPK